jgi:two-component response regulator (ARR-A family)
MSGDSIQENNVSMIITDYWMPEMTGYELLKKVKVRR